MAPALRMTSVDTGPTLQEGKGMARSASHSRLGQGLVAGQVALAQFLKICAGENPNRVKIRAPASLRRKVRNRCASTLLASCRINAAG
jgi:hypothetical protein